MQDNDLRHILKSVAALSVIAIGFMFGLYMWDSRHGGAVDTAGSVADLAPASGEPIENNIGSHFDLVDFDGKQVTADTYDGSYRLVLFGFTSCPDVCPTLLKKISTTLDQLGPRGENIKVILLTVDPETDTPAVLKEYLAEYGPRFVGLTGSKEQVKDALDSFKAYASVSDKHGGGHMVNHSAVTYFMGPGHALLDVFDPSDSAETVARSIDALMPKS